VVIIENKCAAELGEVATLHRSQCILLLSPSAKRQHLRASCSKRASSFLSAPVDIVTGIAIVIGVAGGTADAASADGTIGIRSLRPSLADAGASGFGRRPFCCRLIGVRTS